MNDPGYSGDPPGEGGQAVERAQLQGLQTHTGIKWHLTLLLCHLSPVMYHLSPVTRHLAPVTPHLSPAAFTLSPVTCPQVSFQLWKDKEEVLRKNNLLQKNTSM